MSESSVFFTDDAVDLNETVDLCNNIKSLVFNDCFNKPVDNLPSHITSLSFGNSFNQRVDKLPESIQILNFGEKFDWFNQIYIFWLFF